MKRSPSSALVWTRSSSAGSASPWSLVLVVVAEFTKAIAASNRYEDLKSRALENNDHAADNARQIYTEFYADGQGMGRAIKSRH